MGARAGGELVMGLLAEGRPARVVVGVQRVVVVGLHHGRVGVHGAVLPAR